MPNDLEITSPKMQPCQDVIDMGPTIPESTDILKNLLAVLMSLSLRDAEEEQILVEEPEIVDSEAILDNVDAYQAAQILTHIKEKSKYLLVQKGIERALKKSGMFDANDSIMAVEAFVSGLLNLAFYYSLTKANLGSIYTQTKTSADLTKAFFIGSCVSWLGTKGRYQIKLLETELQKTNNEDAALGGQPQSEDQQFAETPGKQSINAEAAANTNQNIKEAEAALTVSPRREKDKDKNGGIQLGQELDKSRLEHLTYKDVFTFINNFLIDDSQVKAAAVTLMRGISRTNFTGFLNYVSANIWQDKYGLESLFDDKKRTQPKTREKPVTPELLESITYEYFTLLTLMSKHLIESYIRKRYDVQYKRMEAEAKENAEIEEMQQQEANVSATSTAGEEEAAVPA